MIVEYIRYQIHDEKQNDFEAAYHRAQEALSASPQCLSYELARCVEDPASYILRIEWDSLAGHLQGFRQSTDFRSFIQAVRPYVNDIAEMRHYEVTAVKRRKV